jgi:regulator of sigma E protease
MNLLIPVFLFAVFFMLPHDVAVGPAVIDVVEQDSPAAAAGVLPGDRLLEINGEEVKNTTDAGRIIRLNMGETMTFKLERNSFGESEIIEARVKARWDPPDGQGPTGIQIHNLVTGAAVCQGEGRSDQCVQTEQYGLLTALQKGWTSTWDSLVLARNQFMMLFYGGSGPDVAGPAGLGQATGEIVEEAGWQPLLEFAALLSLNLAIINMLPLPMLDGGRVAFVLLEVVRRGKRVAPEKEAIVHLIGLALILTLAVVVTYMDVARIIGGRSLFE